MGQLDSYDPPPRDVSLVVYRPQGLIGAGAKAIITYHHMARSKSNRTARVTYPDTLRVGQDKAGRAKIRMPTRAMWLDKAVAVSIPRHGSCTLRQEIRHAMKQSSSRSQSS